LVVKFTFILPRPGARSCSQVFSFFSLIQYSSYATVYSTVKNRCFVIFAYDEACGTDSVADVSLTSAVVVVEEEEVSPPLLLPSCAALPLTPPA